MGAANIPKGYKKTEVGVIPEDWDCKVVEEIGSVKGGKRLSKGYSLSKEQTPHPYIRVTDMHLGGIDTSDIRYVPEEAFPAIKNYRIYSNDIFISVAGSLGIVGVIPKSLDGASLTENADRITEISCNRDYLLYWLMSYPIQQVIESIQTVGAQPKLALGRIEKFAIALPCDPAEQRAIAAALSDVDELIGALDKLIAKKRAIKQATMQQLLTGKKRLSGFVGEWKVKRLGDISSMHGRIGWQGLTQKEFTENLDEPFLITGVDFKGGEIDWDAAYHVSHERYEAAPQIQLQLGDVLMTKDGTIGKMLYVKDIPYPGLATLNSHLLLFRPINNSYTPLFLFYQMLSRRFSEHIEQNKSGTTFFGLSQEATGKFMVMLPDIKEQTAIASVLSDMDAEIEALEARREKTKSIKQGMMQELLTGKTRLV